MSATTLKLKDMSCASCANSIESAIQQVPCKITLTSGSYAL